MLLCPYWGYVGPLPSRLSSYGCHRLPTIPCRCPLPATVALQYRPLPYGDGCSRISPALTARRHPPRPAGRRLLGAHVSRERHRGPIGAVEHREGRGLPGGGSPTDPPVVNHRQRQRGTGDPAAENQQRQGRGADDGQGRGRSQDVAGGLAFSESAPKVAIKMLLAGYRSLPADRDRTSPHRGVWGVDGPNGTREASRRRRLYWGGAALFLLQLLPRSLPRTAPLSPT